MSQQLMFEQTMGEQTMRESGTYCTSSSIQTVHVRGTHFQTESESSFDPRDQRATTWESSMDPRVTGWKDSGAQADAPLDSRQILKAFRWIAGVDGIRFEDLQGITSSLKNEQVRKALTKDLYSIFARHDLDGHGVLDVMVFEQMIYSSTMLQKAVYEILETAERQEEGMQVHDHADANVFVELFSIVLVVLNVLMAAIAIDHSPAWEGWHWIEILFLCLFTLDIWIRYAIFQVRTRPRFSWALSGSTESNQTNLSLPAWARTWTPHLRKIYHFLSRPTNSLDVLVTVGGWLVMYAFVTEKLDGSVSRPHHSSWWTVNRVRIFRLIRLFRLARVLLAFPDFRTLVVGIWTCMRTVSWGVVLVAVIVFLWAMFVRQSVEGKWSSDNDGIMKETFPTVAQSMLVIFRCMVLNSDGTCMHSRHEPLLEMLSEQLGWPFDVLWSSTHIFITFGIFNAIAAIFVVKASDTAAHIRESINESKSHEHEMLLSSLDKLLRTLIYPNRRDTESDRNPKAKYAAEVVKMIQTEHPEVADNIPNLECQVVEFAKGIHDSKCLLQDAMNAYEASEVHACRTLLNMPSASTYVVNGEEMLLVCKEDASISNYLNIPPAPADAVEVLLLQESETLQDLVSEAASVQRFVKSIISPDSTWAEQDNAGSSGVNLWKPSKGLCDKAIDPGTKSIERIKQKTALKYAGSYKRNRDFARLGLVYNTVEHLIHALPLFLTYDLQRDGMQVVRLENRFAHPAVFGWRDITLLLKVRVPSIGTYHIMEIQLQLRRLSQCSETNHKFYENIRSVLPADVVHTILDRLVTDTSLDLGITKTEWVQCLQNQKVQSLLDALGVPQRSRRRLFDIVDIDGSGTVSSSELHEVLRLQYTPGSSAIELAGCHLKLKDVQRVAQFKLGPQMHKMQSELVLLGTMLESIHRHLMPGRRSLNQEELESLHYMSSI